MKKACFDKTERKAFRHETVSKGLGGVAVLCGTLPGAALIVAGGADENEASLDFEALKARHDGFEYAANVVKVGSGSGIYIGSDGAVGYLLTAGHLGDDFSSVTITGITYAVRQAESVGNADLQLIKIGGEVGDPHLPDLPAVKIADHGVEVGSKLLLMGRSTKVSFASITGVAGSADGLDVYSWGAAGEINWAENKVEHAPEWLGGDKVAEWSAEEHFEQSVFFTRFDGDEETELLEGAAGAGDYSLAGITHGVQTRYGQAKRTTEKGNLTAFVNLATVSAELPDISKEQETRTEESAMLNGLDSRITLMKK